MAARKKSTTDDINIIDLTELIEKGADAEPRKAVAHVEHDDSDIEALLADMEAGDTASRSATPKVDANEKLDMSEMGGLDDLFNDFDLPEQPEPASTSLDNVVDDLMGVGEKPAPASQPDTSFADELDGLLDEAPSDTSSGGDDIAGSLDSLYASLGEKAAAPEKAPANPVDSDLDDILSAVDEPEIPAQKAPPAAPKETPADFPDDLDDLLYGTDEPAPKPQKMAPKMDHSLAGKGEPATAMTEKLPEKLPENLIEEAKRAEEKLGAGLDAEIPASRVQPATDGQQNFALNANIENLNFQARDLGMRMQNCEADLARTRQRMEGLEKSAANAASIEDLLRDGSPLHTGFAALIATSVGQVIQDARANGPDPQTLNKLHQLEIGSKGAQSRLDAMESRINDLEKESLANGQLAEKLGDLVQDGDNAAQRMDAVENRFEAMLPQIEKSAQLADHYDELLHVSARLSALENSLGQLSGKLEEREDAGESLDRMAQEISVLADRLAVQQQKMDDISGNANTEVLDKMAEVEKTLIGRQEEQANALEEMSSKMALLSSSADETEKMEALEKKIGELAAFNDENFPDRLGALEAQVTSALAKAEEAQNGLAEIDLDKAVYPLQTGLEQLEETTGNKLNVQDAKIEALSARCDALAKTAGEETSARLAQAIADTVQLREGLESLEKKLDEQGMEALAALESRVAEIESRTREEARDTAASLEELTQKIDQLGQTSDVDEKLARIESDAQSAKIRVLAIEDKFAELAKKEAIEPLENAIHEIGEFARKGQGNLIAQIGELTEKQGRLLENSAELKELADLARKNDERISALEERLSQADLEKALEPLKNDIREMDVKARKIAAQEETLASHAESLDNLAQRLEQLSSAGEQNEILADRLTGLENEAKETAPRILALEGKVDALPAIENVETALMAKIGSVEREGQETRENLDVLENRLGVLEAGKDSESEIHTRLESIANENAASLKRLENLEESLNNLARETRETNSAPPGFEELKEGLESRIENFEKKLRLLEDIAVKTSEIASQIQALDTTAKSVAYRMDAVEARLDNLEPRFNKEIEKAATSVVSRILREEIGRLLTNE